MGSDKPDRDEGRQMLARGRSAARKAAVTIRSSGLTTCRVAEDGANVGLEFIDQSGKVVAVELPRDQAEILVMTLPQVLSGAVRQRSGNDEARYVFHLDEWVIEGAREHSCLIATLKTENGFEVRSPSHWRRVDPSARSSSTSVRRTRGRESCGTHGGRRPQQIQLNFTLALRLPAGSRQR